MAVLGKGLTWRDFRKPAGELRGGRYLRSGRLVQVLPHYHTPDADIYAVCPQRHQLAARVRAFVDFVAASFPQQATATAR